jgi:hypothetical protein
MRTLSTFAAAAALVAGLATASQAQTPVNPLLPTTGTREIFLDGNIGFDPNFLDINVGYGPFLNPNLQVGGQIGGSGGENSATQYRVAAFANYHFPGASAVLPYVGVSLGYSKQMVEMTKTPPLDSRVVSSTSLTPTSPQGSRVVMTSMMTATSVLTWVSRSICVN